MSIISGYICGDVYFGYVQFCIYTLDRKCQNFYSFVKKNKTEMKHLGFSFICKGDDFSCLQNLMKMIYDVTHFIVTVNTNHVCEVIASVIEDMIMKLKDKNIKKQSDI